MKSIELFVGTGGMALGTARAGMKHEVVIEWDRHACSTLRYNQRRGVEEVKDWQIVQGNVRDYDFSKHKDRVNFVVGGPPCQPFSLAGRHRGSLDERDMWPEAVRAVREVTPEAFIFENVKGLLRQSFANYYNYILLQLEFPTLIKRGDEDWTSHLIRLEKEKTSGGRGIDLRYNVVFQLLNAADYGVPQTRERVLVVGIRSDLDVQFNFPQKTHSRDALLFEKWVSGGYWDRHRIPNAKRPPVPDRLKKRVRDLSNLLPEVMPHPWRTVRDAISDLPVLAPGETCCQFKNHYHNPGARSYPGHTGSPWDEPAKTLKAGDHGVPGGENMLRGDDGSVRYFSVRESARLQTFPDDWVFQGAWSEGMRQLGNAVPVRLGEIVARQALNAVSRESVLV